MMTAAALSDDQKIATRPPTRSRAAPHHTTPALTCPVGVFQATEMAIFKAIEENTLPTEPGRPRRAHDPISLVFWRATWSRGFMTLETVAFSCLREPHLTSIWSANPSVSAGTGTC